MGDASWGRIGSVEWLSRSASGARSLWVTGWLPPIARVNPAPSRHRHRRVRPRRTRPKANVHWMPLAIRQARDDAAPQPRPTTTRLRPKQPRRQMIWRPRDQNRRRANPEEAVEQAALVGSGRRLRRLAHAGRCGCLWQCVGRGECKADAESRVSRSSPARHRRFAGARCRRSRGDDRDGQPTGRADRAGDPEAAEFSRGRDCCDLEGSEHPARPLRRRRADGADCVPGDVDAGGGGAT